MSYSPTRTRSISPTLRQGLLVLSLCLVAAFPAMAQSVTVAGGDGQSAQVNEVYASPLRARVLDASGAPIPGVQVTFRAPTGRGLPSVTINGALTFTALTNDTGLVQTPAPKANDIAGSLTVTATVAGISSSASFRLTNTAASVSVTVGSSPSGLQFIVDGKTFTQAQSFNWAVGSTHNLAAVEPQDVGSGSRYIFSRWSDGGTVSHDITVGTQTSYSVTYQGQYTLSTDPGSGGTISPRSGWFNADSQVQITATPNTGYSFSTWTGTGKGSYTGRNNPATVTMSGPIVELASFTQKAISVTVSSSPTGRTITVDSVDYTAPQTFQWSPGSQHNLSVPSPQTAAGSRYTFASWSDGGAQSHSVTAAASASYTASFTTEHQLTTAVSPAGSGSINRVPASPSGFYAAGTSVQLTASASSGSQFGSWAGDASGSANPTTVVMNAPRSVTANFTSVASTTITSSPSGLQVVVDGNTITTPQSFQWASGTSHTINATSPQGSGGTRYVFQNWSDGGGQSHSVTATAAGGTITANYNTQYLLTRTVSPAGAGTIDASPTASGNFYNAGVSVQLTANANSGSQFGSWSGDLSGSANPGTVVMNGPRSVTANFTSINSTTITSSPSGLQVVVDGSTITTPQSFQWASGTSHTINALSPQGSGGTRNVFQSWSDGGSQSHSITASSAGGTFTASFNTQYLLTTAVSPAGSGSVSASPTASGNFYSAGASVQLTASANSGSQFSSWAGDVTGSSNPATVTMNGPRSVTANFSSINSTTITSSPSGLQVVVDGNTITTPQSFQWASGTSHTLNALSPQGSGGTRRVFQSWSDGGGQSHSITAAGSGGTFTANFQTQHLLTTAVSPAGSGSIGASPSASGNFYQAGTTVQLTANATTGFQFGSWSGDATGSSNPASVVMDGPRSVTATFASVGSTTITSSPSGLQVVVDGNTITTPQSFQWASGTSHTINALSPQGSGGTRRVFQSWSDGGNQSHSITASGSGGTFTANFETQHLLTTTVAPASSGSVAASPSAAGNFYSAGTSVQLTANANSGFQFGSWSGEVTGSSNPATVIMNGPRSVTANFASMGSTTITSSPSGLQIVVDGNTITTPQSFQWVSGTTHTVNALSPQGSGGTRNVFQSWSDGGGQSHSITASASGGTVTATFNPQYLLTTSASPASGGTVTTTPSSSDGFYGSGTTVSLTATANPGSRFTSWSGGASGSANPVSVVMSEPRSVSANFATSGNTTVTSSPTGLQLTVDGNTITTPQSFPWPADSQHTISAVSPQGTGGTRNIFQSWSDGGAQTHTVTATGAGSTITAAFSTQHRLSAAVSPNSAGTITVTPASSDGFYAEGTPVQLTASASSGFQFVSWSGAVSSTSNQVSVTMSSPRSLTAGFTATNPSIERLVVSPDVVSFRVQQPAASDVQTISVFGGAAIPYSVQVQPAASWLSLSPASGETPGALRLRVDAANLGPGDYETSLVVSVPGVTPPSVSIPVRFTVAAAQPPVLEVAPSELVLSAVQGSDDRIEELLVSNTGGGVLEFETEARIHNGNDWLALETTSGSAAPEQPALVRFAIRAGSLRPGVYHGEIEVRVGEIVAIVPIRLAVNSAQPSIVLSQSGMTFVSRPDIRVFEQTFAIINGGKGSMDWQVDSETLSGGGWLSVSPATGSSLAGAPDNPEVRVTVNASGMAPGSYYGLVRVRSQGAPNSPQKVTVLLRVPEANAIAPETDPSWILLAVERGGPETQQDVRILNSGARPLDFTVSAASKGASSFFGADTRGTAPSGTTALQITSKLSSLAAGVYEGSLRVAFADGSVRTVRVTGLVTEPATAGTAKTSAQIRAAAPDCRPTRLLAGFLSPQLGEGFTVRALEPVSVTVRIVNDCEVPITEALAIVRFPAPYPALELRHQSRGTFAGTWIPTSDGPPNVTLQLGVLQFVAGGGVLTTAGPVSVSGRVVTNTGIAAFTVLNSASLSDPREVALGSWVSIFGSGLSAAASAPPGNPYPREWNGTGVFIGDEALPLQYVSEQQINALIPTSLSPDTKHQLLIQNSQTASVSLDVVVAGVQPAIYAINQQGTGQGAVLTQQGVLAGPEGIVPGALPARRGEVIQIFAAGLGPVTNPPPSGDPAPATPPLSETLSKPEVWVEGLAAPVQFSGLAPGFIGLYQVNARIPDDAPTGDAMRLQIVVNGIASNIVTIAVQ